MKLKPKHYQTKLTFSHSDLQTLVTHPDHRCRGAAGTLLKWAMQQAHDHNLPIFLTASPLGLPLYQKARFQVVDQLLIDLTPIGQREPRANVCLIFPAPSPSKVSKAPSIHSKILIQPSTNESDYPRFAEIESAAFVGDRMMSLCFPRNPDEKEDPQFRIKQLSREVQERPTIRFAKALDTHTGETIGWSSFYFVEDPEIPLYFAPEWPPNANFALCKHIFTPMNEIRAEFMKDKKYVLVGILVVMPEYQRRGIGTRLLDWALKQADENGYPCYIDSSPQGLGLYKKLGWEEVGSAEIDEGDWGGERGVVDKVVYLIRPPKKRN